MIMSTIGDFDSEEYLAGLLENAALREREACAEAVLNLRNQMMTNSREWLCYDIAYRAINNRSGHYN